MLIRSIISAALLGALSFSLVPLQAKMPFPAKKSDCCAKSAGAKQHKGCEKEAPKLPQDEQCCATCFACVAIMQGAALIPRRAEGEHAYLKFSQSAESRALRPPVPPPRDALS
jgi:polyferredoxin